MMRLETDASFKAFPEFNKTPIESVTRAGFRLLDFAGKHFTDDTYVHRLIRALSETRVIGVKETLESFEFYARVNRRIRGSHVADLCCGHGLVGLLFAAMERRVEDVTLSDFKQSDGSKTILDAVVSVAPWVEPKVRWITGDVEHMAQHLKAGTSVVGVHACGGLTDRCIRVAQELESKFAVMPCCYGQNMYRGPSVLGRMLDTHLAVDVDRSYRLEEQGYYVDWQFVPRVITPMNRILVGWKKGTAT